MELPNRPTNDVYLPDGRLHEVLEDLRHDRVLRDLRIGIVYPFDFRTRMLPYWYADKRMVPCSVRTLGDVLDAAGCRHLRIVLQQWTPNFQPSAAILDGKPLDILLISAMQVHTEKAYNLIRDACRLGEARPLIIAGGPKATYEPTDFFDLGPGSDVGADCIVTGEVFVLCELLQKVLKLRNSDESIRDAYKRAVRTESLIEVPGLVYLSPRRSKDNPVAINTGMQRLLRNLDELPMPNAGFRMLEKPHRGTGLRAQPLAAHKLHLPVASIITTHGCKFNCSFCSIPSAQQRTWRYKSPKRLAAEIKHLYENFGIKSFFGTDDNCFNDRTTVVNFANELADTQTGGKPLGDKISFYTQATQFDVHKNQDILPQCRKAGLRGIWFGIEDITGELVKKGQSAGKTAELFNLLWKLGVEPMAMLIHSDAQPLHSKPGDLTGLLNQARYMFDKGAVSYQCTYLGPAVGSRDFEPAAQARSIFRTVGGQLVPQAFQDGNHVVASTHPRPWQRQINLLRAYACFYNPMNMLRTLFALRANPVSVKRLLFQVIGHIGLVMTIPKMLHWAWRLKRGPIEAWDGVQPARIPMLDAITGAEINWAINRPTTLNLPQMVKSSSTTIKALARHITCRPEYLPGSPAIRSPKC